MDEDLYDEFGNLIGDPLDSDAELVDEDLHQNLHDLDVNEGDIDDGNGSTALVLATIPHSVQPIVSAPIEDESELPVIESDSVKKLKIEYTTNETSSSNDMKYDNLPKLVYDRSYMIELMKKLPERIRNIAIVGNLHSGKTSFIDLFVLQTHPIRSIKRNLDSFDPIRFTDNHKLERDREMSIKLSPITLMLPDSKDKSFIFNFIDTPGHINFLDECFAAITACDGIVLVLDSVEGLTNFDKKVLSQAIQHNLPITVVLNKFDRLILELKLSPLDCYHKLKYIIDETNDFIENCEFISSFTHEKTLSPTNDNVIFASSYYEFVFTLSSFTNMYLSSRNSDLDPREFSQRLWGDYYYNILKNTFTTSSESKYSHTFVSFILEPIYKIVMHTLTYDIKSKILPQILWNEFGITLPKAEYKRDTKCLLRTIFRTIFVGTHGFVDSIRDWIEPSISGTMDNESVPVLAKVVKLIETADGANFDSLVRVVKGTLSAGSKVKVLGASFPDNEDDYKIEIVNNIYLSGGRYNVLIEEATAGCLVLVSGIDSIISKGATVVHPEDKITIPYNIPDYSKDSVFKVAVESAKPSELPKLLEGLRKVNKAYLAIVIKVEESGEHVILAPGELHLDCALHDLRLYFTNDLQIKVSDPMTKFSETCLDISMTKISTKSPNGHNLISIIAEPVNDYKISNAIEAGKIDLSQPIKKTSKILRKDYGWDSLAARSMWCFGPDDLQSPSLFLDDTLEAETDKRLLYSLKDSISLGFKWSINEGPLCDEPIRNTKFKILDAIISGSEIQRSGAQIIPMTRKACYTGFLTATPRLMEPIYLVDVTCSTKAILAISKILRNKRGYVTNEYEIPGTPLYHVEAYIPVIESFGLETELRLKTQGQSMCFLLFSNWEVVPGDPLDKNCPLPLLKPVPTESLARDFVLKTRRRKGLSGEPSLQKYVDADIYQKLIDNGLIRS